jgi:hypothetical protein
VLEIGRVLTTALFQMCDERRPRRRWQHRDTVLPTLPVADRDLTALDENVLHPKLHALHYAQAAAIEQRRHEPLDPAQLSEYCGDLGARQDQRQPHGALSPDDGRQLLDRHAQHFLEEEEHGTERLVLG